MLYPSISDLRKPIMLQPLTKAPAVGTKVYVVCFGVKELYIEFEYEADEADELLVERGMLFDSADGAIARANEILNILHNKEVQE